MAKAPETATGTQKGSVGQLIGALVVVTALAGGVGAFAGLKLSPAPAPASGGSTQPQGTTETARAGAGSNGKTEPKASETGAPAGPTALAVAQIPVVITNLRTPTDVWIRLETSMVYDRKVVPNPEVAAGQLAADFLAYVRTLSLRDLQTPDGLQDLRSDLDDRAATRSKGGVHAILIRTMVFQ